MTRGEKKMKNKKERYNAIPVEISTDEWETSFYGLLGRNGVIFYNGRNGGRFDVQEINSGAVDLRPLYAATATNREIFDTYMKLIAFEGKQ